MEILNDEQYLLLLQPNLVKEVCKHSKSFLVVLEYSTSFTASSPTTTYKKKKNEKKYIEREREILSQFPAKPRNRAYKWRNSIPKAFP